MQLMEFQFKDGAMQTLFGVRERMENYEIFRNDLNSYRLYIMQAQVLTPREGVLRSCLYIHYIGQVIQQMRGLSIIKTYIRPRCGSTLSSGDTFFHMAATTFMTWFLDHP
jgi:hypothetical protein